MGRMAILAAGLCLAGCAGLGPAQPAPSAAVRAEPAFTLTEMMAFAEASAHLDAKVQAAEARRLKAGAAASPVDRLKLAYLASRGGGEDLTRAQEWLAGLEGAFEQAPLRQYVRELQRLVAAELALAQERRRSAELQEKIERLKSLELQLQERGPGKTEAR